VHKPALAILAFLLVVSCATAPPPASGAPRAAEPQPVASRPVHVVVVGTTDLHGWFNGHDEAIASSTQMAHYGGLAILGGYLANLRARDPGRVVLVDSGDLFQGTLESNLFEGEPVVEAYNALGYAAAAIGNHEFDYGPEGPAALPAKPDDDPLGALKHNASEAKFPFLAANVTDKATGRIPSWARPWIIVNVDGAKIGIIGLSSPETPSVTTPQNVASLNFGDPVAATINAAGELRARGADAIVVIAHMGGRCTDTRDPTRLDSCDVKQEAYRFVNALPPGAIDAYFGGHTHSEMRQIINGIPVLQAGPYSRSFSTLDLWIDPSAHHPLSNRTALRPHTMICQTVYSGTTTCDARAGAKGGALMPREYEGAPVQRDARIDQILKPYLDKVAAKKREKIGVAATAQFNKAYLGESSLGDLLADTLRASVPGADMAWVNSGSIRSGLPKGDVTYGQIFEIAPFDNQLAVVSLTGAQVRELLRLSTSGERGIVQVSGLRYTFDQTRDENLPVAQRDHVTEVSMADGSLLVPDRVYTVVMPDFLAAGGDGFMPVMKGLGQELIRLLPERGMLRDVIVEQLQKSGAKQITPKLDGRIKVLHPKGETQSY
jgi:5'-nucleotidase